MLAVFLTSIMFTSITALQSRDCALLQPADLIAFEALRHAQYFHEGKKLRKSLDALVALDTFRIHLRWFTNPEHILDLKRKVDARPSALLLLEMQLQETIPVFCRD